MTPTRFDFFRMLLAAAFNPGSQLSEVSQRQLRDGLFDLLDLAHGRKTPLSR